MIGNRHLFVLMTLVTTIMGCHSLSKNDLNTSLVENEGEADVIHVKAFDLPVSALMTEESKQAIAHQKEVMKGWVDTAKKCPSLFEVELSEVPDVRECNRQNYYQSLFYKDLITRYKVNIESRVIGGVYTEIFTPIEGVSPRNANKILINLHGGGFVGGSRSGGQMESIPISAIGQIKVVSIDYRMAPEHRFPAATDDVLTVYHELLKTYKAENIGIYGYSAGGVLTSQSVARFQEEKLPLPAAIGMIAGAASEWEGDLMHIGGALIGFDLFQDPEVDYFEGADMDSPLVRPSKSDAVLTNFPPSLLISSTRDFALSNVIHTHRQLVRMGVEADLHVWEGMDHGLIAAHYTPEAREAYGIIVDFFDTHLSR